MSITPKELALKISESKRLVSGHRTCTGCPIGIICRTVMSACDKELVVVGATSCAEVTTTIYPQTSWNIPWMHSAFANSSSTISGVERAYKALKKKGKIKKDIKFLSINGDGGLFDIGIASFSGALERGHDVVYLCYTNEGYQNTNNQRSSATPKGANTTTTPVGKYSEGKEEFRKDLAKIAIAHNIPYVATADPCDQIDLYNKAKKAFETKGPAVIIAFAPCPTNMKAPSNRTIVIGKLAVDTCFWPLYEYENGKYKINYKPEKKLPIVEFLKEQTKFAHLLDNKKLIKEIQDDIDKEWNELVKKENTK